MTQDLVTIQLVTLAVIDEDGENKGVVGMITNSYGEYVTTLPLSEVKRLTPKVDLENIVNPRTGEVYQGVTR